MRVLWIAQNGGNYKKGIIKGTGGWIGALQGELVKRYPDMELGITFESSDYESIKEGNVTYFPVRTTDNNDFSKGVDRLFHSEKYRLNRLARGMKEVMDKYKPDIVHVWGIEVPSAAIIPLIDRPFVVHIQGLLSLYIYIYLPPSFSKDDLRRASNYLNPINWLKRAVGKTAMGSYKAFKRAAERELLYGKYVKNWIGRTDWDQTASQMLSPESRYFHCEELMRGDFNGARWHFHYDGDTVGIHSSLSGPWYKGIDVVLKTAEVMKRQGVKAEWNIYGVSRDSEVVRYFIRHLGISPENVGVRFHGHVDGKAIREGLLQSDVYVHPSYIENSSNAIAEAQMLGVPVIAQFVGGNPTMLKNDSGVLVAPNEPYILASKIMEMRKKNIAEGYSERALAVASERQNTEKTCSDLINIYKTIISESGNLSRRGGVIFLIHSCLYSERRAA